MKLTSPNWTFLKKYAKYLFWLAPALIIMGLTAGAIAGWGVVPVAIVLTGLGLLVLGLIWAGYQQPQFWSRRSTQVGTNALIATLAMLVIVGLVNFLVARYNARVDLTENQFLTLAPQTQEVLQDLQQPVKAWIFTPNPNPADRQLLDNYRRETEQFSYEFVDPQAKPGMARDFGVQSIGETYLQEGDKRRFVQTVSPEERLSERKLTSSLSQVTDATVQKAYFLQGHGERNIETAGEGGFSQVKSRLSEEGLTPEPLNLAQNPKIPDDTGVIVIAGARQPLLEPELNALKEYQKRKSGLLVLIDPQTDPKLESLLQPWGVTVDSRLVIDPAGEATGMGAGVVIVNQYSDHPITKGFNNGISLYPLVRPLQIQPVDGVQVAPLLTTSDKTTAQQIDASGAVNSQPTDPKGPFDIGAAFSRTVESPAASPSPSPSPSPEGSPQAEASPSPSPIDANEPPAEARLVVIGSSGFATDGTFDLYLNSDVLLNSMSWLSQQDDQVLSIRPREMTNRRIVMNLTQQLSAVLLAILILPLVGFGTAALMWWRKR